MIEEKKINLDRYFEETKYGYIFLDDKFKYLKLDKEEIFKELNLSYATFRTNKNREKIRSRDMLQSLLKYFGFSDINKENKLEYENYIELLVHNVIYKNEIDLENELNILNEYITTSSYLKPIFVLLKVFLKISDNKNSKELLYNDLKNDYEYIECFRDYYDEELEAIYYLIVLFQTEKITQEFKQYYYFQKDQLFHGLYCFVASSIYYMKKEYAESILYATDASESFSKELNINRLITVNINLCAFYNKKEEYTRCISISKRIVNTLLYKKEYKEILYSIQIQLIIALLHLNINEEAFNIYNKYINVNNLQDNHLKILYILISFLRNDNWQKEVAIFNEENNLLVNDFIAFLITKNISEELEIFLNGSIGQEIEKILKKNKKLKK